VIVDLGVSQVTLLTALGDQLLDFGLLRGEVFHGDFGRDKTAQYSKMEALRPGIKGKKT
jgi:hypothetical protein